MEHGTYLDKLFFKYFRESLQGVWYYKEAYCSNTSYRITGTTCPIQLLSSKNVPAQISIGHKTKEKQFTLVQAPCSVHTEGNKLSFRVKMSRI